MTPEFAAEQVVDNSHRSRLAESSMIDQRPINEFDALMRCAPGDEPEMAQDELQEIREAVADCMERLSEMDRFVLEAIHSERLSLEALATRMGLDSKNGAWKRKVNAEHNLRKLLMKHPTLQGRIQMYDSWNDAAHAAVMALSPSGRTLADDIALAMMDRKVDELRNIVNGRFTKDAELIASKLETIGLCASSMLSNQGAWSVLEMVDLLVRKQHDYGHGNINAFGLIGLVVRVSDKLARYHNLAGKPAANEPRVDALVDIVGYATIAHMLRTGTFDLKLEEQ